jgi:hypothetical protein
MTEGTPMTQLAALANDDQERFIDRPAVGYVDARPDPARAATTRRFLSGSCGPAGRAGNPSRLANEAKAGPAHEQPKG